jgi:hypothetical protein
MQPSYQFNYFTAKTARRLRGYLIRLTRVFTGEAGVTFAQN